jgi:hypothetical protein
MNTTTTRKLVLAGAFSIFFATPTIAIADQDFELEPCINGGVSATGMYSSQAVEDAALSNIKLVQTRDIPGSDLEADTPSN